MVRRCSMPFLDRRKAERRGFQTANLSHSNFTGADAKDAYFRGAVLESADFSAASLKGIQFRGAKLDKATLERAQLEYSDLRQAHLTEANLADGGLDGRQSPRYRYEQGGCSRRKPVRRRLTGAILKGVDFSYAELLGARLEGAIFDENTKFNHANIKVDDCWGIDLSSIKTENLPECVRR